MQHLIFASKKHSVKAAMRLWQLESDGTKN